MIGGARWPQSPDELTELLCIRTQTGHAKSIGNRPRLRLTSSLGRLSVEGRQSCSQGLTAIPMLAATALSRLSKVQNWHSSIAAPASR